MKTFTMIIMMELALSASAIAGAQQPVGGIGDLSSRDVDPRAWTELDIVPMPKNIQLTNKDLVSIHLGMRFAGSVGDPECITAFRDILNTTDPSLEQKER